MHGKIAEISPTIYTESAVNVQLQKLNMLVVQRLDWENCDNKVLKKKDEFVSNCVRKSMVETTNEQINETRFKHNDHKQIPKMSVVFLMIYL